MHEHSMSHSENMGHFMHHSSSHEGHHGHGQSSMGDGHMDMGGMDGMDGNHMDMGGMAGMDGNHMDMGSMDGMGDSHMDMGGMKMHAMHLTPVTVTDFLIEGICIDSIKGILLAMVFVMALTMIFEAANFWIHIHLLLRKDKLALKPAFQRTITGLLFAACKMLTVSFGYLIMLCVMTMNAWLLASAIIGSGLGYLFVRPFVLQKYEKTAISVNMQSDEMKHLTDNVLPVADTCTGRPSDTIEESDTLLHEDRMTCV